MSNEGVNLLTEEAQALIGSETDEVNTLPVEACDIRRYCEATENMNPLYLDEDYARQMGYGGIIAPPAFYQGPFRTLPGAFMAVPQGTDIGIVAKTMERLHLKGALDVGQKMELFAPVRPGDILTRKGKIVDIAQKQLKLGPALLCTIQNTITNQKRELVCLETTQYFFY
jgi:acyl dehydratase